MRNITTFPTRLICGRVGDIMLKRGKVNVIVQITYLLFGLLCFLCSFVRSFPLLMLYMGVSGVVEGVFWVTYPLLVVEVTGGYHADEAFGAVCVVVAFSMLLGPPTMGKILFCRFCSEIKKYIVISLIFHEEKTKEMNV